MIFNVWQVLFMILCFYLLLILRFFVFADLVIFLYVLFSVVNMLVNYFVYWLTALVNKSIS